ncbi:MAG TPA: hypothetical protein VF696_02580 [Candidatus Paceibacterota bacterium]|jgi:hypothetical protein
MTIEKIYIGGWFQRTTLHLAEIYDFLKEASSPLDLDAAKLQELHGLLSLESVSLRVTNLEYIEVRTTSGFGIEIFEDGLMVLSADAEAEVSAVGHRITELTTYYEERLSPAISYLFSLGAPVPKELANIKTIYPYFLVVRDAGRDAVLDLLASFNEEEHFEVREPGFEIYRGDKLYVIVRKEIPLQSLKRFIEEQVFIREFKGQLHRYLNLHRGIWERIASVKEKGTIRGRDVSDFTGKIESYAKTINLIEARINQMGTYLRTRESVAKNDPAMKEFLSVLSFKHETLSDTLQYVKEIWSMTKNYVKSAEDLFSSIQAKATESSVKNLTIITSMGVGATLIGLFAQKVPEFTVFGAVYFFALAAIGWIANRVMREIGARRAYKISDTELAKDL